MIPNILNTLIGIALVYTAVLAPTGLAHPMALTLVAVVIFVLSFWALATDHHKWQNTTDCALAIVLFLLAGLQWGGMAAELLMFWGVFWVGMLVAVFALWAALYRPLALRETKRAIAG